MTTLKKTKNNGFRSHLQIFECEGHDRYFEMYENNEHRGTFERDSSICAAFGGRVAEVYGYAAYEAACKIEVARDPEGYDFSDVIPAPVLVTVRDDPAQSYRVESDESDESYTAAWANVDSLPYPVLDAAGARLIDLGSDVYGLVDYDAGKYRLGIYWNLPEDDGGVCAEFERFTDLEAFATRLSAARAPLSFSRQELSDLVDGISVATEDLEYRAELTQDYEDEDRNEMRAKAQRLSALFPRVVAALSASVVASLEPTDG